VGKHVEFNFQSASLLKQQSTNIHVVAPLGQIIQFMLVLLIVVCFVGKRDKCKFYSIWFHPTRMEPTIYRTFIM